MSIEPGMLPSMGRKTKGDCYEVHAAFLRDEVDRSEEAGWRLCHGTVTNAAGQAIGHCWLEHDGYAYDFSNGNHFEFEVAEFRQITQARDVRSYTPEEVSINIIRHRHCGPWA